MKLYDFESLDPRKACAVSEIVRWNERLNELPAWREPFPKGGSGRLNASRCREGNLLWKAEP